MNQKSGSNVYVYNSQTVVGKGRIHFLILRAIWNSRRVHANSKHKAYPIEMYLTCQDK